MPEMSTEAILEDRFSTTEIVGTQKTGKTRSLITLLKHLEHQDILPKNLYLFDLDGDGAESLLKGLEEMGKTSWVRRPEDGGRLRIYRYNTTQRKLLDAARPTREQEPWMNFVVDLNSIFQRLDPRNKWRDPKTAPGAIALDPCTSLSEMIWDYILRSRGKELGGSRDNPLTESGIKFGWVEPTDWTSLQEKIIDVIKTLKSFPCHRVVTFHEEVVQEMIPGTISTDRNVAAIPARATGGIYALPLLSGKLQSSIGKFFSIIVYSRYINRGNDLNASYIWHTRPSENERIKMAGSRSKQLEAVIPQDFCKLLD